MQVYAAVDTEKPRRILSPASTEKSYKNWNRKEIQNPSTLRHLIVELIDTENWIGVQAETHDQKQE